MHPSIISTCLSSFQTILSPKVHPTQKVKTHTKLSQPHRVGGSGDRISIIIEHKFPIFSSPQIPIISTNIKLTLNQFQSATPSILRLEKVSMLRRMVDFGVLAQIAAIFEDSFGVGRAGEKMGGRQLIGFGNIIADKDWRGFEIQWMFMLRMKKFNALVDEIESRNLVNQAYQIASQRYCLKPYHVEDITPASARTLYQSIQTKFYKGSLHLNSKSWYENQLKLFIWTLMCYLYLNSSDLSQMTEKDWQLFHEIFPKKNPQLFEYQSQALFKNKIKVKDRLWESSESQILTTIMRNKNQDIKWNEISKDLYFLSEKKFFRTAKQCRQRWLNHLDPSKKKGKWTAEECLIMFKHVKTQNKKWAELVIKLGKTRNEHTIKNKFNSLFKKQQKLFPSSTDEEIYDMIINRINNTVSSNNSLRPSDITFDIEDIQSTSQQVVEKVSKKQIIREQNHNRGSFFSFDAMVRKLKNYNPKKAKPDYRGQMNNQSLKIEKQIKQENESFMSEKNSLEGEMSVDEEMEEFQEHLREGNQSYDEQ